LFDGEGVFVAVPVGIGVAVGVNVGSSVLVGVVVGVFVGVSVGSEVFVGIGNEVAVLVGVVKEIVVFWPAQAVKSKLRKISTIEMSFVIVYIDFPQVNIWSDVKTGLFDITCWANQQGSPSESFLFG
jgi:hypothetical protein